MSTTTIVAELLVAGIHAVMWISLLVFSITGVPAVDVGRVDKWVPLIVVGTIGACYAIGVLIDRVADSVLRAIDEEFRRETVGEFPVGGTRILAAHKSSELASYLGYIRSRMRIARAMYFNSMFLLLSGALFVRRQLDASPEVIATVAVGGLALLFTSRFAWWRISHTFYKRLRQAREILLTDRASASVLRLAPERVVIGSPEKPRSASREAVHRDGTRHYSVHLICYRGDEIFLQRRSRMSSRNPDCWTSTVSGHITEADAMRDLGLAIDGETAVRALVHETLEELDLRLPVTRDAVFLGTTDTISRGGGETCFCKTFVYAMRVDSLKSVENDEVAEVKAFPLAEVERALASRSGLLGSDKASHTFADNFPPVFATFRSR